MTIALKIGENEYDGWSSGLISSTLLDLSDRFILSGTNIFTSQQVKAGDLMVLEVGGDPVITGYGDLIVDTRGNLTVEGRDKTGDLVDSMAAGATSFIKQSVLSIIQGLSTPFNVEAAGDSGPTLEQFTISPDETVAQAILRLVSNYGIGWQFQQPRNLCARRRQHRSGYGGISGQCPAHRDESPWTELS